MSAPRTGRSSTPASRPSGGASWRSSSSSSGTRFGSPAKAAGRKKPVATPDTPASTTSASGLSTNGSAAKTPKRTRSETIMSRRRERRSTSGPRTSPITTIGRKSAMRSPATHTPEPVSSLMWSVSAIAAMYVPKPEPAVARNRSPNAGERRTRPRRLEASMSSNDATTCSGFPLRAGPGVSGGVMQADFAARGRAACRALRAAHRARHLARDDAGEPHALGPRERTQPGSEQRRPPARATAGGRRRRRRCGDRVAGLEATSR